VGPLSVFYGFADGLARPPQQVAWHSIGLVSRPGPVYQSHRRSASRWPRNLLITIVVILALLVGADFATRAVAENVLASKIEQQGLHTKPDVTIEGFPFLTQAVTRHFGQVDISSANVPEGPVTISTLNATASNVAMNSYAFSSGTIRRVTGTALISFASLAATLTRQIGELGTLLRGAGLRLTAAGPAEVRASMNLIVTSGSAVWRISEVSGTDLNIRLIGSSGLPAGLLGSIQNVTLHIPKLPLGLTIGGVHVTGAGVVGRISASNVSFGS
jgi:LmeA-like phospholipid-binding